MGGPGGLLALSLGVGLGAGLGAVAFRYLIEGFTYVFTGHDSYGVEGHVANPLVPGLGIWFVALVPIVGGLLYGPLVERYASEARGHGVPEVMLAVARKGGRIRPIVAVVKSLASALCIGSGGSVGREGPIVQIGSALGSTIGQLTRAPEARMRLLVACGAAGGISATFNAPIAGVFFALEVILRDFETRSFSAVVIASVTADVIGRAAFGSEAFLKLPQVGVGSVAGYPLYLVLGLLAAVVGVFFIRFLYELEDRADRLWRFSESWRPAAGGCLLGLLLLAVPQMYGVGYQVLESAIAGNYALLFLLALLASKVLATSLTLSIGGSGGVFAPSLFMGAMLGTAFGLAAHGLLPGIAGPAGAYGLIGMGAVFAAAARAPMTAILIIFELTGDYRIMLPLMLAVVIATALANRMSPDSIYTLKLARRGIDLLRRRAGEPDGSDHRRRGDAADSRAGAPRRAAGRGARPAQRHRRAGAAGGRRVGRLPRRAARRRARAGAGRGRRGVRRRLADAPAAHADADRVAGRSNRDPGQIRERRPRRARRKGRARGRLALPSRHPARLRSADEARAGAPRRRRSPNRQTPAPA